MRGPAALLGCMLGSLPLIAIADPDLCATAPEPVVTLSYESRYKASDESRATVDPLLEAEAEEAVAPLDEFITDLADQIDRLYSAPVKDREGIAACIVEQMAEWAKKDALSDLETETVRLTVGSRYAGFALILWQTLPYAPKHPERNLVVDWLNARMHEQMVFWKTASEGARQGNLRAWAGLAAAALSLQHETEDLLEWSHTALTDVLCSANADGSLPQEMARGRLALHYQLHAVAPLVTGVALLERQGVPASRTCGGAVHRVVQFTLDDIEDGRKSAEISGERQSFFDGGGAIEKFQLSWIEAYLTLTDDSDIAARTEKLGTLAYSKLGGNQTALWGN